MKCGPPHTHTCSMTITLPLASAASLLYARISCRLALITGTTQPEVLWASSDQTFASERGEVKAGQC